MANEKYDGIERYIFADAYNFFLKYKDIPNQDSYWEACINDAKRMYVKYKEYQFAREIITATMNQLEFIINKGKSKNYTREQWEQLLDTAHKFGW